MIYSGRDDGESQTPGRRGRGAGPLGPGFPRQATGSHGEASWASAGGHLEWGEYLEECARRETLEELGVEVSNLQFLCVSNILAYEKHYVDFEFLADIGDQEPWLAEPDAFSEFGWFPLDQLPEPLFEAARLALDSLLSGRHYYPENGSQTIPI